MVRLVAAGGALAVLACLLTVAALCSDAEGPANRGAPAVVRVNLDGERVAVDRGSIRSGPVVLQVTNRSGERHDLQLLRLTPTEEVVGEIDSIAAGASRSSRFTIEPGRYALICDDEPSMRVEVTAY